MASSRDRIGGVPAPRPSGSSPVAGRIGVTCCAIEAVDGRELTVTGLDAVSGTPVIDLKPTMADYFRPWPW
ncbi:hypothetical protein GCM10010168_27570 [Actinoplanes ianthinogenes]|uniref:TsaA-like domain-containing protein n=1 Tax=Actinoplanes ianthinogenes TaxID=122358 RepID=A0ABN6C469_9ACTN|nr:TrmO family methyltransferase [Actinoplanes ianthinogenes]BCJ39898.1 hypothetical protein Aiant_05550 [Actinoplanes ianthinogenes]GGR08858.1 hypothetical protein GCM10010168_27570 [Actinoplanes ianthinogenes]